MISHRNPFHVIIDSMQTKGHNKRENNRWPFYLAAIKSIPTQHMVAPLSHTIEFECFVIVCICVCDKDSLSNVYLEWILSHSPPLAPIFTRRHRHIDSAIELAVLNVQKCTRTNKTARRRCKVWFECVCVWDERWHKQTLGWRFGVCVFTHNTHRAQLLGAHEHTPIHTWKRENRNALTSRIRRRVACLLMLMCVWLCMAWARAAIYIYCWRTKHWRTHASNSKRHS